MASLRLTFPEKDEPTVIALTGARLTIGRLPFNTIQIIDRTVSGFHAELISEHGHYRLHDRGSSNGTFVNGQKVSDFHLTEACTIAFGTVEAQFSPEAVAANEEAENFPTRSEITAVRKENAELKATVEVLREEANALRMARPMEAGDASLGVPKEEFDKVVVERETLKEARLKQDEEIERLKTDLAVLKRDRVNLQLAYDGLQREITDLRAKAGGVEEIAVPPKAAAAALAAQVPSPGEEVRVEVPVPMERSKTTRIDAPTPPAPEPAPVAPPTAAPAAPPAAAPAAPAPAVPPTEQRQPQRKAVTPGMLPDMPIFTRIPTAKPAAPKTGQIKPFAPVPKVVPAAAPTATAKPFAAPVPPPVAAAAPAPAAPEAPAPPAFPKPAQPKAPIGLGGSGLRPLAKPAMPIGPAPSEEEEAEDLAETVRLNPPRPAPTVKLPTAPTVKLPPAPAPAPKAGPKGTQKIS